MKGCEGNSGAMLQELGILKGLQKAIANCRITLSKQAGRLF